MARSLGRGEDWGMALELKKDSQGIRRAAMLMHQAHGKRAAVEAALRALAHRRRGDNAGFDVWSWICAAIRALENTRVETLTSVPSTAPWRPSSDSR
jgi:hypothetical protein